ncbi:Dabb family protein [Porphyromonas circumdentaria]|uniref:Dabb family protein n=1 Tax=Porphyromonas circumdentaria TaxID=29524 RepID=UPI0026DB3156|nr:Dabb family protein [Porphyromonas circumdentaria]MDO4722945.1 Dabb family protein [Porphyromonas circumdentaria]
MIRHIVIFNLDGFASAHEAEQHLSKIKVALEALPQTIEPLKAMKVEINTNPKEGYGFLLEAHLPNWESIEVYARHPEHEKVVQALIVPYKKNRACVDFEC